MDNVFSLKFVLNKNYLIKYNGDRAEIYEINSELKLNLILTLTYDEEREFITDIRFNPIIDSIIIISFWSGHCKIYNLLNKNKKEDILFESINNKPIMFSIFNLFDPNRIATVNRNKEIFFWDVRNNFLLTKIGNIGEIYLMKWSYFGSDYFEILKKKKKKAILLNIKEKSFIAEKEFEKLEKEPINFFFMKEKNLILVNQRNIEQIKFENENDDSMIIKVNYDEIEQTNENLILDYNILVLISQKFFYLFNLSKFSIIKKFTFDKIGRKVSFSYKKKDNELGLKYINDIDIFDEKDIIESIEECKFQFDTDSFKIKNNITLINIKNNFYEHFYKKIFKYVYLLNFNENVENIQDFKKKYMKIKIINDFFNEIKNINIFIRKDFITQIITYKKDNKKNIINYNKLKISDFPKIINYIEKLNEKGIKDNVIKRKNFLIEAIKKWKENDNNIIIEFYIEVTKLLIIDNTNREILEMYLLLLNFNEKDLIKYYGKENIDYFENEVNYYSVCFSKNDYKILFEKDKESERKIIFQFLEDANNLEKFDYENTMFQNLMNQADITFPDFNQPIDYDCKNDELKWFLIRKHIFIIFQNLKLEKKSDDLLDKILMGIKTIINKKLLQNEEIIKNKYKLQSTLYLIINPFDNTDDSINFFCNSILCNKNNIDELKQKNFIINNKGQLEYDNIIYDNIEDICLENLCFKKYIKEEKYNFDYLLRNYVKNKKDIKQFLKNILKKNVFIEVYKILFGENNNYKLLDERYLEEFIDNRLEFVPIKPYDALAISDKIALNTLISTKRRKINLETDKITLEHLKEILNTSNYVVDEEHEIFHLLDCLPYYENNCSISINTPRKKEYDGKSEGGNYLELLLFNKIMDSISLGDALFILNEDNYNKSLTDFKNDFEKKNYEDLVIKGVFKEFNDYLNIYSMTKDELNKIFINQKSKKVVSIFDSYIINYLENDVAGKVYS